MKSDLDFTSVNSKDLELINSFSFRKYTTITSHEQRTRYKNDFNKYYNEYKELYDSVNRVTKRFLELEASLKQANTRSPKFGVS